MTNVKNAQALIFSALYLLILATFATACVGNKSDEDNISSQFSIYVFDSTSLELTNNLELANYHLTEDDIDRYDWNRQTIYFKSTVKEMYLHDQKFLIDPSKFVITMAGEVVAEGDIIHASSPRWIRTSVMYVETEINTDEELRIILRPQHRWGNLEEGKSVIDLSIYESQPAEEIRQFFLRIEKLVE